MDGSRERRLLIVDDEEQVRKMLDVYFSEAGYRVATAEDVPGALARLPEGFDAVLSDIKMPGVSGIEFLQQARRSNPNLGVFLITGYPTLETIIDAKLHGAVAYFRKPLQLIEVDSRLRAFLGEDPRRLVEGRILVIGQELLAQLQARLARFETVSCEESEQALLLAVGDHRPKAILAKAGQPATPVLLQAYRKQGREANCFILLSDAAAMDAANEMLFGQGTSACVLLDAPQEALERAIQEAVERCEAQKIEEQRRFEELSNKCAFAKAYRHGYYCQNPGDCIEGLSKVGWIAIEGKEYQKCPKRPLLVESLEAVGFANWTGQMEVVHFPELRKQLLALIRDGKREIVIDCQGLQQSHFNLFEILSDAGEEMIRLHPDGGIHLINLASPLLDEFRKASTTKSVHCYGSRMVDERNAFDRWGSRFD